MGIEFLIDDDILHKFRIYACPSKYIFKELKLSLDTQDFAKRLYNRAYLVYDSLVYLKIV